MAEVKWIKIVTDIFDDEKILLIESLPSSDSIIVIWFKLLCLAGKNNNSGVFMLNERVAYTEEMLATIFRRDVNTVRFALKTFENYGMIEVINNVVTIPNWDKHQALDTLEKRREKQRIYMQERRKKQKSLAEGEKNKGCNANCKANGETNSETNCKPTVGVLDTEVDTEVETEVETHITEYEKVLERHLKNKDSKYNYLLKYLVKNKVCLSVLEEKIKVVNQIKNCKSKAGALITAIREDWQPVSSKDSAELKFNNFTSREYDYEELEAKLLGWD